MASKFVRQDQAVVVAIDDLLHDDEPEADGLIELHKSYCAAMGTVEACTCAPRLLLVPPARIDDFWRWLRKLDAVARGGP